MSKVAYHGGAFFDWVGNDFKDLDRLRSVINADVLDAWFDPSPLVIEKIKKYLPEALKTSPPTQSEGLIKTISEIRGVDKKYIMVGGGSSDLMYAFFPNMLNSGDRVLILDPMYGEYQHIFKHVVDVHLFRHVLRWENNFCIDNIKLLDEILEQKPKIVVLVNPNSPTGQFHSQVEMLEFIKAVPESTLVVVDETYIEYVGTEYSLEKYVGKFNNLVVIKSMSKVYALSGARAAYMLAPEGIVERVSKFIPPWSVGLIGQVAGVEALLDREYYAKMYKKTHELRQEFIDKLSDVQGISVIDSVASFFLIHLRDERFSAKGIVSVLRKDGIFLRDCDSMSANFNDKFIRVAVKKRETNMVVVEALKRILL